MAGELENIESRDTLAEAMTDFASALWARNRSPRTIQSYEEAVQLLASSQLARRRSIEIGAVSRSDVEAFLVEQLSAHKPTTAANRYRSLRAYFRWLAESGHLPSSPMAGMTAPTAQDPLIEIVTPGEIRALFKVTSGRRFEDYRDNAILRVWYDTGTRLSEVAGLTVDSFDRSAKTMLVRGKGSRFRVVPYGDACERALRHYLRARQNHELAEQPELWLGSRRKPLTTSGLTQMLRRRCLDAGIGVINPHRFRHTAAAMAKSAGYSEGEMMTLFGWRSTVMVHRYGKVVEEQQALDAYRRHGAPGDSL